MGFSLCMEIAESTINIENDRPYPLKLEGARILAKRKSRLQSWLGVIFGVLCIQS